MRQESIIVFLYIHICFVFSPSLFPILASYTLVLLETTTTNTHTRTHIHTTDCAYKSVGGKTNPIQPPKRDVVAGLFDASDFDNSGGINRNEFNTIMKVCCAQLASRIISYYALVILLVPIVSERIVNGAGEEWIPHGSYREMAAQQMVHMFFFFLIIPLVWNTIDGRSQRHAIHVKEKVQAAETQQPLITRPSIVMTDKRMEWHYSKHRIKGE